ncbi:HAD hydrolase family protein [Bacillus sp. FJAT-27251]|uniref:HAD hydrolase family protein n=1 Tax=Bacillus sp. FJAT-27251 TaxID=1684142 RepID=UPI0006A7CC0C|nr:HAD hydrolase family protein [Bacillus sp. FJAT-27251]
MAFYMFDVDGVLTDELARPDEEVLRLIEKLNEQEEQLAFITGRSRQWLADNVFTKLDSSLDWSGLYCVAEHGAIIGKGPNIETWTLDQDFVTPDKVKDELYHISQNQEFKGLIEWDDTKESMATVESVHGEPGDDDHLKKTSGALKKYAEKVREIAGKHDKKVVVSTYGVDVIPPDLSKKIGAIWVLGQASFKQQPVYVFGDSKSDFVIAETASGCGADEVTFFWVGEGDIPESESNEIQSKNPSEKFAAGTEEILKKLLSS